jgi:hypothetical protein
VAAGDAPAGKFCSQLTVLHFFGFALRVSRAFALLPRRLTCLNPHGFGCSDEKAFVYLTQVLAEVLPERRQGLSGCSKHMCGESPHTLSGNEVKGHDTHALQPGAGQQGHHCFLFGRELVAPHPVLLIRLVALQAKPAHKAVCDLR